MGKVLNLYRGTNDMAEEELALRIAEPQVVHMKVSAQIIEHLSPLPIYYKGH